MTHVYALRCASGKWYVGQTTDIVNRFQAHKEGHGAAWTKLYPAESIVKLSHSTGTDFLELSMTLEFMEMYGIDNVRGGPFSNVHMPADHVRMISKLMISNAFPRKWVPKDSDSHLFDDSSEPEAMAKRPRPDARRHGLPWSFEEDTQFLEELRTTYKSFQEIANIHERTEGSIKSKVRDILDKNQSMRIEDLSKEFRIEFTHDGKSFKRSNYHSSS